MDRFDIHRHRYLVDPELMDLPRAIIRRFDDWVSKLAHVEPFSDDPQCVMRIQVGSAAHTLELAGGSVLKGGKILILHLWNQRLPLIPPQGADLNYAVKLHRLMIASLKAVARYIQNEPSLHDVQAVGGITAHVSLSDHDGGSAMLRHLGFTLFPYYRPAGWFGEFWENFYTWWLMWTYNPATTRARSMFKLQRTEFWTSAVNFLDKYAR